MKFSWYSLIFAILFSLPTFAISASPDSLNYTPLQALNMPNGKPLYSSDILVYLANIYTFAIAMAGVLAVIKIVYAGIKYMTSEAFGLKTEAKKEMKAAVYGLLMALGSYVFLYTLNPNLVKFKLNIGSTNAIVGDGTELFANSYDAPVDINSDGKLSKEEILAAAKTNPILGQFLAEGRSVADAIVAAAQFIKDNPIANTELGATNNGRRACAYAVNQIIEMATGVPGGGGLSVDGLNTALSNSARFQYVGGDLSQMQPGDVIITQDKGSHTGIAGADGTILNNSSNLSEKSGGQIILQNSTPQGWTNYFGSSKIYRPV